MFAGVWAGNRPGTGLGTVRTFTPPLCDSAIRAARPGARDSAPSPAFGGLAPPGSCPPASTGPAACPDIATAPHRRRRSGGLRSSARLLLPMGLLHNAQIALLRPPRLGRRSPATMRNRHRTGLWLPPTARIGRYLVCTSISRVKRQIADLARLARVELMCQRQRSLLDSMIRLVPKLDVAGSIPVSPAPSFQWVRSIWHYQHHCDYCIKLSRSPRGAVGGCYEHPPTKPQNLSQCLRFRKTRIECFLRRY
jgi:hypothetical protein